MIKFKIYNNKRIKDRINFDIIKEYSFLLLKDVANGNDGSYEVDIVDTSLGSYKEIVETVFKSVIADKELLELYKETNEEEDNKQQGL